MFKIIKDEAKLAAYVKNTITSYKTAFSKLHTATVSVLVHAAITGRADLLNTLYSQLNTNDQSALRGSYIPRIHAAIGGIDFAEYVDTAIDPVVLQECTENGEWLRYEKGAFYVVSKRDKDNAPDCRRVFVALAEERLINPDAMQGWRKFFERNTLAEVKVFGNQEALKALRQLCNKAGSEGSQTDRRVAEAIAKATEFVETYMKVNAEALAE